MASRQDPVSPPATQPTSHPDWATLEQSAEFRELSARRRRFILPAMAAATIVYAGFIVLASWGRAFMASSIYHGFTVAYAFGVALIIGVWLVAWRYVRFSNQTLTPMIDQVTRAPGASVADETLGTTAPDGGLAGGTGGVES